MKRVISRTILALVLASSLCASVIPVMAEEPHAQNTVISYADADIPDGTDIMTENSTYKTGMPYWRQLEGSDKGVIAQVKKDPHGSGKNCIYVKGSPNSGQVGVLRGHLWAWNTPMNAWNTNMDSVCFEYKFLYRGTDQWKWICELIDGVTGQSLTVDFETDKLRVGTTATKEGFAPNVWYDLKIYFNFVDKTFRAYVNGNDVSGGVQPWAISNTLGAIREIAIYTHTNSATPFELYIEKIGINNMPDQPILVDSREDGIVASHFPTSTYTIEARDYLDPASIKLENFEIDGGASIAAAKLSDNNSSIALNLCDLDPDKEYTIKVKDGVKTADGVETGASEWKIKTLPVANYTNLQFTDGEGNDISQTGLKTGDKLNFSVDFVDYSETAGDTVVSMALYNKGRLVDLVSKSAADMVRFDLKNFKLSLDVPTAEEGDEYKAVVFYWNSYADMKPFLKPMVIEPGKAWYSH